MFSPPHRRRASPSKKNILLCALVSGTTIYLAAVRFFLSDVYLPVLVALVISFAVLWLRARSLRAAMPAPYGKGKTTTLDPRANARLGMLFAVGGGLLVIGMMASVFFLPHEAFFALFFGATAGLPFSQVLFFGLVIWYERKSRLKIFYVTEVEDSQGEEVLVKTVEMS